VRFYWSFFLSFFFFFFAFFFIILVDQLGALSGPQVQGGGPGSGEDPRYLRSNKELDCVRGSLCATQTCRPPPVPCDAGWERGAGLHPGGGNGVSALWAGGSASSTDYPTLTCQGRALRPLGLPVQGFSFEGGR
jgi:hypothetical protein